MSMPGRLMVGRMALDHVVKVRVLPGQSFTSLSKRSQVKPTEFAPDDYIASQEPSVQKVLDKLHTLIKKALPGREFCMWEGVFWGGSEQQIIGYGNYTYLRADKTPVEWFIVGLTRQQNYFSVYVNAVEAGQYLTERYGPRLGKVKTGKSSVTFRNLADVHLNVLSEMVEHAGKIMTPENES